VAEALEVLTEPLSIDNAKIFLPSRSASRTCRPGNSMSRYAAAMECVPDAGAGFERLAFLAPAPAFRSPSRG
jgi:hypothetical protein